MSAKIAKIENALVVKPKYGNFGNPGDYGNP
jgi:hypothetical protein